MLDSACGRDTVPYSVVPTVEVSHRTTILRGRLTSLSIVSMRLVSAEARGDTIVDHDGGVVVAARIALGVYRLVALEWRLVHRV
jgi:hypothetical protein